MECIECGTTIVVEPEYDWLFCPKCGVQNAVPQ